MHGAGNGIEKMNVTCDIPTICMTAQPSGVHTFDWICSIPGNLRLQTVNDIQLTDSASTEVYSQVVYYTRTA